MKRNFGAILFLIVATTGCGAQEEGQPIVRAELDGSNASDKDSDRESEKAEEQLPPPAANSACKRVMYENISMTHCIADPAKHRITTDLGPKNGDPYRDLANLAAARPADAAPVVFVVNGGMFDDAGKPIGYYVESGERLKELNRNDGPGNFHLKPNGVFFGTGGKWQIRTADDFYSNVGDRPQFGTQSGPMLVIKGKMHPEIAENGPSRARRNGVGVDNAGRAHFVISETPLSFGQLARYFRDEAKTPNALYLDGKVSALWDPASDRLDRVAPLGPLIVVEQRE